MEVATGHISEPEKSSLNLLPTYFSSVVAICRCIVFSAKMVLEG